MSWVCAFCRETNLTVPKHERLEARLEYRRLSDQGRERVIKLHDICRACLRKQLPRETRGTGGDVVMQAFCTDVWRELLIILCMLGIGFCLAVAVFSNAIDRGRRR